MSTIPYKYDIPRCLLSIAAIEGDVRQLTATLTECQFQAPPRTGGWSIGYCIEHLILTGNAFLGGWDAALRTATANGQRSDGPFPYSWLGRAILRFAEPPYRVRVKTTRPFAPCGRRSKDETIRQFLKMHQELAARVSASRGLDVINVKVRSPFVSWIRYPLGLSFDFALAHERRHLWQAWQVRQQLTGQEACK
jgi:hypothetical protein